MAVKPGMSEVRFNWNVFPSTRLQESQIVTPVGCLYTPVNEKCKKNFVSDQPIQCETCTAIINPHILLDRANNMWKCPFCGKMSYFFESFKLDEDRRNLPGFLDLEVDTVEYHLPSDIGMPSEGPLVYYFVVDSYEYKDGDNDSDKSFERLKLAIISSLAAIPDGAHIGLISFDSKVTFHNLESELTLAVTESSISSREDELDQTIKPTDYFRPDKFSKVSELLNLDVPLDKSPKKNNRRPSSGAVEVNETTRNSFVEYIRSLQPTYTNSHKPPRNSGLALYVLTAILSRFEFNNMVGTTFFFSSGPCTLNPGMVMDCTKRNEHMRSHNDIAKLQAPYFVSALKYYHTLALMACGLTPSAASSIAYNVSSKATAYPVAPNAPRWSFELFFGSLDQAGVYEMKPLVTETNGTIHLTSSFANRNFEDALMKSIGASTKYKCELTVLTSGNSKVSKLVGNGHSLPSSYQSDKLNWAHHEKIADTMGEFDSATKKRNFTNRWSFNALKELDTMALFFEPTTASSSTMLSAQGVTEVFIQFRLKYWDLKSWKIRVTTVRKPTTLASLIPHQTKTSKGYQLVNSKSKIVMEKEWTDSFDPYAWTVLFTRLMLDKIDSSLGFENFANITNDIHGSVVKLLYSVGGLLANAGETLVNPYLSLQTQELLHKKFKMIPQLIFSLSRNPCLINIFNSSPDETAFHYLVFMRSSCIQSSIMIDPVLYFETGDTFEKVPLKIETLTQNGSGFYVLDCGFNVIIYNHIADDHHKLLKLHLSQNEDLVYNRSSTIAGPLQFLQTDVFKQGRSFTPSIIVTQTDHSQARFFTARLSPRYNREMGATFEQKRGFWDGLKSFIGKSETTNTFTQYYDVLSDDVSFEKYCKDLFNDVQSYSRTASV